MWEECSSCGYWVMPRQTHMAMAFLWASCWSHGDVNRLGLGPQQQRWCCDKKHASKCHKQLDCNSLSELPASGQTWQLQSRKYVRTRKGNCSEEVLRLTLDNGSCCGDLHDQQSVLQTSWYWCKGDPVFQLWPSAILGTYGQHFL